MAGDFDEVTQLRAPGGCTQNLFSVHSVVRSEVFSQRQYTTTCVACVFLSWTHLAMGCLCHI